MSNPTDEDVAEVLRIIEEQKARKAKQRLAIPVEFAPLQEKCRRLLAPMKPADDKTRAKKDFLFTGCRTVGADQLPRPHLIYFLLKELLGYTDLGRWEKLAWSIPVDLDGHAYLVEHRKFGVGIFTQGNTTDEIAGARRMVGLIGRAVRTARPYFEWKAEQAVAASQFNVTNNSAHLFERFTYLKGLYEETAAEAERRKDERIVTKISETGTLHSFPSYELARKGRWLAMAAIDAFFSWTEHMFIHLAILNGRITTGKAFSDNVVAEWNAKFKLAVDIAGDPVMRRHYDELVELKRRLRNFVAHGAFGKEGEALHFHSSSGAVPVYFDAGGVKAKYSLTESLSFDDDRALKTIGTFIDYLWSGPRQTARRYIQDGDLPMILTLAQDGTYAKALASEEEMEHLLRHLGNEWMNAANMDW
jgi:hypothetical protein